MSPVFSDAILKRTLRFALLPPLLAVALLMFLLIQQLQVMRVAADDVDRTDRVIAQADRALRLLVDMEAGYRGFLVGGDEKFLDPYNKSRSQIGTALDYLDQLIRTSRAHEQVEEIRQAQQVWQRGAERRIRQRRVGAPNLVAEFNRGEGKAQMDAIRSQFDQFVAGQQELRDKRQGAADTTTKQLLTFGGAAALVVGAILATISVRQLKFLSLHYHRLVQDEQQAREFMTTTLQSIGDAVLVINNEGRITLMNSVAEQITGWKVADGVGKDHRVLFDIYHAQTSDPMTSPVETVLQGGQTVYLASDTILRQRDGSAIPVEDSAAPIRNADGTLVGVILVFRDVSERRAREAEIAALTDKDRRIAETLQRSMLLTPPDNSFPGLTFSTHYEAAWNEAQVGGDFHDAFPLQGGKAVFVVGDVTGKGLEAAAYTAEIKFVLRAYLREDPDPANAMARLNNFLVEAELLGDRASQEGAEASAGEGGKMAAVSVAVLDLESGTGAYAGAGAEFPLIVRADGQAEELSVGGKLAGMEAGGTYDVCNILLSPGDLLIFTTDGITEARRGRKHFFGPEGIVQAVREKGQDPTRYAERQTLDDVASHIADCARDHAGGKLRDDLCLVLVSRALPAATEPGGAVTFASMAGREL